MLCSLLQLNRDFSKLQFFPAYSQGLWIFAVPPEIMWLSNRNTSIGEECLGQNGVHGYKCKRVSDLYRILVQKNPNYVMLLLIKKK